MGYKLTDIARTTPALAGDLDRSTRRQVRVFTPDRREELRQALRREDERLLSDPLATFVKQPD